MRIDCEIFLDGRRFKGFLTMDGEYIIFYKKRLFFKEKPLYRIPLKSISEIEIKWRIFYIKGVIRVAAGILIKEIIVRGDKSLADFLNKISLIVKY